MSVVRVEDEGGERAVGVDAQAAGDGAVAGAAEQIEGGVAEEGHDGRAGADVAEAGVLAEGDVLGVMQR